MDLFNQWVWIYAVAVEFLSDWQMLSPYPTISMIHPFLDETFADIAINSKI